MKKEQEGAEVKLKRKFDSRQEAIASPKPAKTTKWIFIAALLVLAGVAGWYFVRPSAITVNDTAPPVAVQQATTDSLSEAAKKDSIAAHNTATALPVADTNATANVQQAQTPVERVKENSAIPRPAVAYFKAGSSQFSSVADKEIAELIAFLKANPGSHLSINGYASSEGNLALNQRLSSRRAEVFKRYLVKQGVAPERLMTTGLGIEDPAASNASAEGRAKNRRVEAIR